MSKKRKWKIEDLKKAVRQSTSLRMVIIKLNLKPAGGNYDQVKKYIKENYLNTKHFKGRGWNKGLKFITQPIRPLKEIMILNSDFQSYKLKNRLFKSGIKTPKCEECGWEKNQ